jgi:hypothetical protein
MRDAGNDYRDDVGDDVRWLSYGELGQVRGISTASAIRLVFRRKWRRQDGNDGTVRVAVPVDEANPQREVADNGDGIGREISQVVGLLETATAMLRERGEEADVMLAVLHATSDKELARAEAETVTEREARRQAEGARADAEAQLSEIREGFERERREAEARRVTEQAAREKAEAEAARLRQENQARRDLGLLARLRAALRRE